ncbi:MAG: cation:proton antiporter [Betaproteobacteria bacterium]
MDDIGVLPTFPFAASNLMLVGAILLCGLAAGHLFSRLFRLPRITGFVAAGLILGPGVLGVLDRSVLDELSIFADISLGLILFELGRRLNVRWLIHDPWLLVSSVGESLLSFLFVYAILRYFDTAPLYAATAAAIAMATSPAVLIMIVHDQRAKGPLTERMLALTALNNVYAFLLIALMFGLVHLEHSAGSLRVVLHPLYLIAGSCGLGFLAFVLARTFARWLGKREDAQFVMLLGLIVGTVGCAISFNLSVLLALLAFGLFARNLDREHDLMAVEFGPGAQFFMVMLFVITGAGLQPSELAVAGIVGARIAGKMLGILLFVPLSGIARKKALLLGVGMVPMSAIAVVMVQGATALYPEFGAKLSSIVLSAAVILELVGPLATQLALRMSGEAAPESGGSA